MNKIIASIEQENMKKEVPVFEIGDTVRVYVKVVEGTRERLQAFEGTVIARKGGGLREQSAKTGLWDKDMSRVPA